MMKAKYIVCILVSVSIGFGATAVYQATNGGLGLSIAALAVQIAISCGAHFVMCKKSPNDVIGFD